MLIGRFDGPLSFRMAMQPAMAALLAIRAGYQDFHQKREPFGWLFLTSPGQRRTMLRESWKDGGRVFILAIVLDVLYELIVYQWIYPVQALVVAAALAVVPY